jgi:hypothetical protein
VGLQEVRWEGSDTPLAGEYTSLYGKGNETRELGTVFCVHKRMISAYKRGEAVSDRKLYIILRRCWCHIIILTIQAPTEDKIGTAKDRSFDELECVLDSFPKYHIRSCSEISMAK